MRCNTLKYILIKTCPNWKFSTSSTHAQTRPVTQAPDMSRGRGPSAVLATCCQGSREVTGYRWLNRLHTPFQNNKSTHTATVTKT